MRYRAATKCVFVGRFTRMLMFVVKDAVEDTRRHKEEAHRRDSVNLVRILRLSFLPDLR